MKGLWESTISCLDNTDSPSGSPSIYTLETPIPADLFASVVSVWCSLDAGIGPGGKRVNLHDDTNELASVMCEAVETNSTVVLEIDDISTSGLVNIEARTSHDLQPQHFGVIPLVPDGVLFAFLVAPIGPHRSYDPLYEEFFELVKNAVETQISRFKLAEKVEGQDRQAKRASITLGQSELKFQRFAKRSTTGLVMINLDGNVCHLL